MRFHIFCRHVEVGYQQFDDDFIIKGNDERKLKRLFSNEAIRELITLQPRIHLTVTDDERCWYGSKFSDGVDELYFDRVGVIKDIGLLKDLFILFAEILDQLCDNGSAFFGFAALPWLHTQVEK